MFPHESLEAFTAVIFQVTVFWDITPCSVVVGYQCFRGPCCLQPQGEILQKMEADENGPLKH